MSRVAAGLRRMRDEAAEGGLIVDQQQLAQNSLSKARRVALSPANHRPLKFGKGAKPRPFPPLWQERRLRSTVLAMLNKFHGNLEESAMKITDVMTPNPEVVTPDQPIQEAARRMLDADTGALPVGEDQRLIGMVTDRDITVRAVAEGRGPETPVREVMSEKLLFAWDDQDVDEVAMQMSDAQVRRMPILSRQEERLVGMVSIGDLVQANQGEAAGVAVAGVTEPGGEHNQSES
jgi:CBS domain-containing protein